MRAGFMVMRQTDEVLSRLRREARHNLFLLDLVDGGSADLPDPNPPPQIVVARSGDQIAGVASLRPSIVLEAEMGADALEASMPLLSCLEMGLIKSQADAVASVWDSLRARGRRSILDRCEECLVLETEKATPAVAGSPAAGRLRRARASDLDALVFAARSSLLEENRPDPFHGDPEGFRHWVRGRISRARLLEVDDKPVFVGYVDVRRPEGWLIQGVYTWPDHRRRGFARAGMAGLVGEAVQAGAEHVQLAVVEGNLPAMRLYEGLGFKAFSQLRTILFH
jgi:predicted GNAT family acetyltransferase